MIFHGTKRKGIRTLALILAVMMFCVLALNIIVYEGADRSGSAASDSFSHLSDLFFVPASVSSVNLAERSLGELQSFNLRRNSSSYIRELASTFKMPVIQKVIPDGRAYHFMIPITFSALALGEKVISYVHHQNGSKDRFLFF